MISKNIKFTAYAMFLGVAMVMPQGMCARGHWHGNAGHRNNSRSLTLSERLRALGAGAANGVAMSMISGLLIRRGITNANNQSMTLTERGCSLSLYSAAALAVFFWGTKFGAKQLSRVVAERNRKDLGDAQDTIQSVSFAASAATIGGYLGWCFGIL